MKNELKLRANNFLPLEKEKKNKNEKGERENKRKRKREKEKKPGETTETAMTTMEAYWRSGSRWKSNVSRKTGKESGFDKAIQIFEVPLAAEELYDEITVSNSKYKKRS